MSQTERVHRILQILQERNVVAIKAFLDELEISRAQFKRDLDFLRDRFRVPIEWNRLRGGYVIARSAGTGPKVELPGPMYTAGEIHALLLMQNLITQLQPGLLDEHLGPLSDRLKLLLGTPELPSEEIRRRIRVLHMTSRPVEPKQFRRVSEATLGRRRLHITYHSPSHDILTERDVSPQRLAFYRGNWYLDSWCHLRKDLRSFAVDAILEVKILEEKAREVAEDALDAHLGAGYGIFAGPAEQKAVLRFDPAVTRWVSREIWHPRQKRTVEPSGHLVLTVPYSQDQELMMDILRYGGQVEVLAPESLRDLVIVRIDQAHSRYQMEVK